MYVTTFLLESIALALVGALLVSRVAGAAIGVLGGLLPALGAARLSPIQAMRALARKTNGAACSTRTP